MEVLTNDHVGLIAELDALIAEPRPKTDEDWQAWLKRNFIFASAVAEPLKTNVSEDTRHSEYANIAPHVMATINWIRECNDEHIAEKQRAWIVRRIEAGAT